MISMQMASFRFNFGAKAIDNKSIVSPNIDDAIPPKAKEIKVSDDVLFAIGITQELVINKEISLKVFPVKHVVKRLQTKSPNSSDVLDASLSHTDLVPDLYEGGLKIWECALDLVGFLQQSKIQFEDKRVLEIGCGAGLPGIFGLLKGGCVDFQDYNYEVIENFTIPNAFINLKYMNSHCSDRQIRELLSLKCRFYAGDWKCLENFINPDKDTDKLYDIILTSETIYDPRNQKNLLDFIKRHLKYPYGLVYLAAKTCYFGVGGGTRSFETLVNTSEDFVITVNKVYKEGVQREILTMTWKKGN